MGVKKLDWKGFDWKEFQTLSIRIAENLITDCYFEEYLKPGHKQDGIDIINVNKKDGNFITILCKCVQSLSKSDLKKIIKDFQEGEFYNNCSRFILYTSADLQNSEIQKVIRIYEEELLKNANINFECWDINFIELQLQKYWNLVSHYFSKEQADRFCYPQLRHSVFKNIRKIDDFIPRKITQFINNRPSESIIWNYPKSQALSLCDLFIKDRLKTNKICLIGEAYQGKSLYLKQTAFELKQAGLRIQPLLIEIKQYSIQPIESILTNLYGEWKNIPFKDLIILIDGLDEVPTDRFIETVQHINEFSISHPTINIITSCRKLFFNFYDVNKILEQFSTYELYPLDSEGINKYLENKLVDLFDDFKQAVNNTSVMLIIN